MQNRHRRATIFQKFSFHQSKLLDDVRKKSVALIKGHSSKENLMDEIYMDSLRQKPTSLEELCRKTNFSRRELKVLYRGFKQECPSGIVNEDKFKDILCQFFPQGDASQYAFLIFPTFDKNRYGFLTFEDLVTTLSHITRGSIEERLSWIFHLYDRNADGYISFNEVLEVDKAVHSMLGKLSQPTESGHCTSIADHASEAFERLDINKDGQISETDFYQAIYENPILLDSLAHLDTIM